MHGVFFLDEAYRLAGDGLQGEKSDFGLEALETIMQAMEDYKGKMIFILAGYEDRMESLFEKNEGLRSRIAQHFKLEDYTPDELVLIAENILEKKGYNISKCKEILKTYVKEKIDNGVLEGNGRTIRNMVEKIILNHSIRIGEENVENITVITNEDVENAIKPKTTYEERESLHNLYKESQKELEGMIGLHDIKMQMKRLGNFQYVQSKRKEKGMQVQKTTHHMMFLGEPGTGKTTVARIVGKMLRGAGVLSNGHFLEITKDDLTGSKIPTTRQVKKVIQKAKGGVLFLDEAYTLCNDLQGKEALDALNREMEENREDLVVIYAGYEEDMQKFIQANEGLASRIPYHFKFSSYNPCELIKMLFRLAEKEGYRFSNDATLAVNDKISELHTEGMIKGNGRWIRNLFDQLLMAQSQRIVELSTDDLETIEEIDVLDAISEMEYSYMENNNDIKNIIKDIKKLA
jgi:replication-associated recombination protein RarA